MKRILSILAFCTVAQVVVPLSTVRSETDSELLSVVEELGIDIVGPYDPAADAVHPRFNTQRAVEFKCDGKKLSLGGFGDTFRRSDTRRCSGRRTIVPRGGFVPGLSNRTYVASFTPCTRGRGTLFTPAGELVAVGSSRGGCPNGRATVDFCLPNGGGAVQMAAKFGERGILQWETARGVECFNILYRCTVRNGRIVPNRSGVNERGEPSLRGVCR